MLLNSGLMIHWPIKSEEWNSAVGETKSCSCLGFKHSEGWIGGAYTACVGLVYNCKLPELLQQMR